MVFFNLILFLKKSVFQLTFSKHGNKMPCGKRVPFRSPPAPPAGAKKENPCARIEKPPFLFFFSLRPHFLGAYPAFGAKKENRSARI